ncbi:MAG: DUF2281 domain-containing protein [Sphingobacteriaceae bacterium]|nr:MAG: DUF2281 domain-containing protein [Sphingobacteriaceae bacterium]
MVTAELIEKLEKLSPELQSKVEETVDQLLTENQPENADRNHRTKRKFGDLKGLVVYMADDFDEPLEDFKDYM